MRGFQWADAREKARGFLPKIVSHRCSDGGAKDLRMKVRGVPPSSSFEVPSLDVYVFSSQSTEYGTARADHNIQHKDYIYGYVKDWIQDSEG